VILALNPLIPSSHKKPSERDLINASIDRFVIFPLANFFASKPGVPAITGVEIAAKGRKL
jgi:hypothetical protein